MQSLVLLALQVNSDKAVYIEFKNHVVLQTYVQPLLPWLSKGNS